jgi:hypothetical protein
VGVGCELSVGSDVVEDLLYQGEYVRVVDGVDLAAPVAAASDDAPQAQLGQMLARGGNGHPGLRRQ